MDFRNIKLTPFSRNGGRQRRNTQQLVLGAPAPHPPFHGYPCDACVAPAFAAFNYSSLRDSPSGSPRSRRSIRRDRRISRLPAELVPGLAFKVALTPVGMLTVQ